MKAKRVDFIHFIHLFVMHVGALFACDLHFFSVCHGIIERYDVRRYISAICQSACKHTRVYDTNAFEMAFYFFDVNRR